MRKISTKLPFAYRLDMKFFKRRGGHDELKKQVSNLKKTSRAQPGNKLSKYFRHIFENHKHIKRILGSQIALMVIVTSIVPAGASNNNSNSELTVISAGDISLKTEMHIQYPLEKIKVNQAFYFFHPGVDFEGTTGEPVKAVMPGKVESIQRSKYLYGNAVIVRHGDNFTSLYAHLSRINVVPGQEVNMDTIIGAVGSTGRSTGDHLHLEIRENGKPINPFSMLPKR